MLPALLLGIGATPTQVAVFARIVDGRDAQSVADVEQMALRGVRWFTDVAVISRDRMRRAVEDDLLACKSDRACAARRLRFAGVDEGIYVFANFALQPALVTVSILDARKGETVANEVARVEADLVTAVSKSMRRALLAAGHRLGGQVVFALEPPETIVSIEGQAPGRTILVPGAYSATASAPDHEPGRLAFTIDAGTTAHVDVTLQRNVPVHETWWFWTAIGAGVAVIAAGTALGVGLSQRDVRYTGCHGADCR